MYLGLGKMKSFANSRIRIRKHDLKAQYIRDVFFSSQGITLKKYPLSAIVKEL